MTFFKSKEKICKCTHHKDQHKRKYGIFTAKCTVCKCKSYLRRDKPTALDFIFTGISIGIYGALIGILLFSFELIAELSRNSLIGISNFALVVIFGVGCFLYLCYIIGSLFWDQVKRKEGIVE